MRCEDVSLLLPDHVLGTLAEESARDVARHLRGCGACRQEARDLDGGLAAFVAAGHVVDPPPQVHDRVMAALAREREDRLPRPTDGRPSRWIAPWARSRWAAAAVTVALLGSLAWGAVGQVRAGGAAQDAASYRRFLHALGGREARVASLEGVAASGVEGSAILYDSEREQSWILVIVRAPGHAGQMIATVETSSGGRLRLFPIKLDDDGTGSTWLVTADDISPYRVVEIRNQDGVVVATGTAEGID
jgi:hypothetical protein